MEEKTLVFNVPKSLMADGVDGPLGASALFHVIGVTIQGVESATILSHNMVATNAKGRDLKLEYVMQERGAQFMEHGGHGAIGRLAQSPATPVDCSFEVAAVIHPELTSVDAIVLELLKTAGHVMRMSNVQCMETGVLGVLGLHALQNALLFEKESVINQLHNMAEKFALDWRFRRALALHLALAQGLDQEKDLASAQERVRGLLARVILMLLLRTARVFQL